MTRALNVFKGTNAELMVYVHQLYPFEGHVLDPTWGEGGWWTEMRPKRMVRHDLYTLDNVDFRYLPHRAGSFDCAVFDPAYVSVGGRETTGLDGDMASRYGMHGTERTPRLQWNHVIVPGVIELARVLMTGGVIYVKCQNYVSSNRMQWAVPSMHELLRLNRFSVCDEIIHLSGGGPQPLTNKDGTPRRQNHFHTGHSVLIVARRQLDRKSDSAQASPLHSE